MSLDDFAKFWHPNTKFEHRVMMQVHDSVRDFQNALQYIRTGKSNEEQKKWNGSIPIYWNLISTMDEFSNDHDHLTEEHQKKLADNLDSWYELVQKTSSIRVLSELTGKDRNFVEKKVAELINRFKLLLRDLKITTKHFEMQDSDDEWCKITDELDANLIILITNKIMQNQKVRCV